MGSLAGVLKSVAVRRARGDYKRMTYRGEPVGPGLAAMLRETPAGLCPFCLDPLPKSRTRPRVMCDAPECKTAYFRCWRRDERHPQHHVVPSLGWRALRRQRQSEGNRRRWAA